MNNVEHAKQELQKAIEAHKATRHKRTYKRPLVIKDIVWRMKNNKNWKTLK